MSRLGRVAVVVAAWLAFLGRAGAVAPEVRDEGKFFSPEAIKKANEIIHAIALKYNRDVLVETLPAPPADAEKVKAMDRKDRVAYFHKLAEDRIKARAVHGVYLLVCKDPPHFRFEVTEDARGVINMEANMKLDKILLDDFRNKKYDDGLLAALKFLSEKFAAGK